MSDMTRIYVCEGDQAHEATEFFFIEVYKYGLRVVGNDIDVADVMGAALQACFDEGVTLPETLRVFVRAWRRSHAKE